MRGKDKGERKMRVDGRAEVRRKIEEKRKKNKTMVDGRVNVGGT